MSVIYFQNKYFPKVKVGPDFRHEHNFRHREGVAFNNGNDFFASGLNGWGTIHVDNKNENMSLKEWVMKSFGDESASEKFGYNPGTFYKRIWRPSVTSSSGSYKTASQEQIDQSFIALKILLGRLEELFEFINPCDSHLSIYGHKIREILLLACMEIESSWSMVLRENEYSSAQKFTTNDYVKLCKPMFLDSYELSLQSYPKYPSFSPFESWNNADPTASLSWYEAYHKTKHNREKYFALATLNNAITAVGAAVVMFYAQFGYNFEPTFLREQKKFSIMNIFKVVTLSREKYNKEFYIPKLKLETEPTQRIWIEDWSLINYPF